MFQETRNTEIVYFAVRWLRVVHLVYTHDELFHSQCVRKEGVLTSLAVFRNAGLKFTSTGCNNEDSTVSLDRGEKEKISINTLSSFLSASHSSNTGL